MATRRYGIKAGEGQGDVTEAAGAAVSSDAVELTVELAATTAYLADGSTQRQLTKEEVLNAIKKIEQHIIKGNWPPA